MSDNNVIDLVKTNVFQVQDKSLITVDLSEVTRKAREQVDAVDKANRRPTEETWQNELVELERTFRIWMGQNESITTLESLKERADQAERAFKTKITGIEAEIKHVRSLLNVPGLDMCKYAKAGVDPKPSWEGGSKFICQCSGCLFRHKIESLEHELGQVKKAAQKSVRQHGDMIRNRKAIEPLRKRFEELRAQEKQISLARRVAKGMTDGDGGGMREMPLGIGDRFRAAQVSGEAEFDLTGFTK